MASTAIQKANRNPYFDNLKFFLIFLVVIGHVISPLKGQEDFLYHLYAMIYIFHMPAFILISGYFSKGYKKKGYLKKTFKKILIPYFIFQIFYSIFYYLNGDKALQFDLFSPHWTMWFLLSLFTWNLLLFVFGKWRWYGLAAAVLIGMGVGFIEQVGTWLSLSRTFVFFPFFFLGFLLKREHIERFKDYRYTPHIGAIILITLFIIVIEFFPEGGIPWLLGSESYREMGRGYVIDAGIRFVQYIATPIVIFAFMAIVPKREFSFTVIGQRTMSIYLLHGIIIQLIQTFIDKSTLYEFANNYALLVGLSLIICFICGNYYSKKLIPV
ncbi:acyltransferase family protein [Alkalihalobacillus pseudalcaliphilus]|uniref:acyltransferase family protein n=1 Tax=Alkalihalobacillus pseudalcaliphilus TaxID=79884 RepID=UPI00064D9E55|nr:acyltransferase family protein [Alkalihalobacillus pseudalcaliphilus]KMK75060.1 acyltransferase [Alkalihalobacillus pseudalcaliphilus]